MNRNFTYTYNTYQFFIKRLTSKIKYVIRIFLVYTYFTNYINLITDVFRTNFCQVKIITLFDGRITLLFIECLVKEQREIKREKKER